jgi:hypothetical protein
VLCFDWGFSSLFLEPCCNSVFAKELCSLIISFTLFNVRRSTCIHHFVVRCLVNYHECYPPLLGQVAKNVPSLYL